jgi:hypothetical protein
VLHDGAPVGERIVDGTAVPMFDEIALLQPSSYATFAVTVAAPTPEAMAQLTALLAHHEAVAEDWSQSVRTSCMACSDGAAEGTAHVHGPAPAAVRGFGIASGDGDRVRAALAEWGAAGPERIVGTLERVL